MHSPASELSEDNEENAAAAAAAELEEADEACFDDEVETEVLRAASAAATAAAPLDDRSLFEAEAGEASAAGADEEEEDAGPRDADNPDTDDVDVDGEVDAGAPPLTPPIPNLDPSFPTMASNLDFFFKRVGSATPAAGDLAPLAAAPLPPLISRPEVAEEG